MDHVNQVAAMSNHAEAKKLAHSAVDSSNANPENKKKIKLMIDRSKSPAHLAQAMANHILAHPSEGIPVIKGESLDKAKILSFPEGKTIADLGQPTATTPPRGKLKQVPKGAPQSPKPPGSADVWPQIPPAKKKNKSPMSWQDEHAHHTQWFYGRNEE